MTLSDKDILLSSLLGSRMVQAVPRLEAVENEMMKHVGYPVRIVPFQHKDVFASENHTLKDSEVWSERGKRQFMPLFIKRAGTDDPFFQLPYEPMISITGKNNIVKRSIAKATNYVGTVKEHFSQDDYDITITGTLFGKEEMGTFEETFPREDFEKLKKYCVHPKGLEVKCELFQMLEIQNIVVESFDFPFSKGEEVQAYSISAISDFSTDFLLEIKD